MSHRIVIYDAGLWSADDEIAAAVAEALAIDDADARARLGKGRVVYLEDLEETPAGALYALLERRGVDADLEPMAADPGKVAWLEGEIPKWIKRGLVHPLSAPRLYRSYGIAPPPTPALSATPAAPAAKDRDQVTLIRAVLTIGAVLVGLGLILFVASHWQRIPAPVKIAGSLALTLATLYAAYRLRFVTESYSRVAAALFLVACLGIGGVLALIAQTYHLGIGLDLLVLVWGALCVPVALLLRFQPALYLASGLWLWSYYLHADAHDRLPWFYPVLLLGFLIPYSLAIRDRNLFRIHLGVLMLALVSTIPGGDFAIATAFVLALLALQLWRREPLFDWLLLAGVLVWHIVFIVEHDDFPNVFQALPLVYLGWRALRARANALMIAIIASALIWLFTLQLQLIERLDLDGVEATDVFLWLLAIAVLLAGAGLRLASQSDWTMLASALRIGGGALALFAVYVLSFRFYGDQDAFFDSPLFLASALLFAAAGFALAGPPVVRAARLERRWSEPLLLGLIALALVLALVISPALAVAPVLFNLILFAAALALMMRGHRERHLGWYNAGIALFVLLIVTRYFDTFVDLLPRSVFFVLGGLFLIVWAILVDRQRKRRAALREEERAA